MGSGQGWSAARWRTGLGLLVTVALLAAEEGRPAEVAASPEQRQVLRQAEPNRVITGLAVNPTSPALVVASVSRSALGIAAQGRLQLYELPAATRDEATGGMALTAPTLASELSNLVPMTDLLWTGATDLAVATGTNQVAVLDLKAGQPGATADELESPPLRICLAPDGASLAQLDAAGTVTLRDAKTLKPLEHQPRPVGADGQAERCDAVAYAGTRRLALYTASGLTLWNLATGTVEQRIAVPGGAPRAVIGDTYGAVVAAGDNAGRVHLAYTNDQRVVASLTPRTPSPVSALAYAREGIRLAAGYEDGTIRIWQAGVFKLLAVYRGHAGPVTRLAWPTGGAYLISGGEDGTVRFWDVDRTKSSEPITEPDAPAPPATPPAPTPPAPPPPAAPRVDPARLTERRVLAAEVPVGWCDAVWSVSFGPTFGQLLAGAQAAELLHWVPGEKEPRRLATESRAAIIDAAWSPDGLQVALAADDGAIAVVDPSDHGVFWQAPAHAGAVQQVAWSPAGRLLASAGRDDRTVKLWDAVEHRELAAFAQGDQVWSLAFQPGAGEVVAAGLGNGQIRLWSATQRRELRTIAGPGSGANRMAFSPDGTLLATVGANVIRVYRVADDQVVWSATELGYLVEGVAFSPDGSLLATTGGSYQQSGELRLWDVATGKLARRMTGHGGCLHGVAFNPDGRSLAAGTDDGRVLLWGVTALPTQLLDAAPPVDAPWTGTGLRVAMVAGRLLVTDVLADSPAQQASLAPNTWLIAIDGRHTGYPVADAAALRGAAGTTVKVRVLPPGACQEREVDLTRRTLPMPELARPRQAKAVASAELRNTIQSVDLEWSIDHLAVRPEGDLVAIQNTLSSALLFGDEEDEFALLPEPAKQRPEVRIYHLPRQPKRDAEGRLAPMTDSVDDQTWSGVTAIAYSSGRGDTFAAATTGGTLALFEVRSGKMTASINEPDQSVMDIGFSPDNRLVVTKMLGSDLVVREAKTLQPLPRQPELPRRDDSIEGASCFAFVDQTRLAFGTVSGVYLWNSGNGQTERPFQLPERVGAEAMAVSAKGGFLAVAGWDGRIYLFRLRDGRPGATLAAHGGLVGVGFRQVAVSADGKLVAAACDDTSIAVWNVAGQPLATFTGHQGPLTQVAFHPSNTYLISGAEDGTFRFWDLTALRP